MEWRWFSSPIVRNYVEYCSMESGLVVWVLVINANIPNSIWCMFLFSQILKSRFLSSTAIKSPLHLVWLSTLPVSSRQSPSSQKFSDKSGTYLGQFCDLPRTIVWPISDNSMTYLGKIHLPISDESSTYLGPSGTYLGQFCDPSETTLWTVIPADGVALGAAATTSQLQLTMIVFIAIMLHKVSHEMQIFGIIQKSAIKSSTCLGI